MDGSRSRSLGLSEKTSPRHSSPNIRLPRRSKRRERLRFNRRKIENERGYFKQRASTPSERFFDPIRAAWNRPLIIRCDLSIGVKRTERESEPCSSPRSPSHKSASTSARVNRGGLERLDSSGRKLANFPSFPISFTTFFRCSFNYPTIRPAEAFRTCLARRSANRERGARETREGE